MSELVVPQLLHKGYLHSLSDNPDKGKGHTQAIERKYLTLRRRIKRLARKTICFSKLKKMHDIVIGLFLNKVEFKWAI